jgi:hypothetical protein
MRRGREDMKTARATHTNEEDTLKKIFIVVAVLALVAPLSKVGARDFNRSIGIGLRAGLASSVNGSWTAENSMRESAEAGPDFAIAIEKWIGGHFRCEMAVMLAWMNFKEGSFPAKADSPSFTVPGLTFSNSYHFTSNRVRPFLAAGAGVYFWKINTDGPLGCVYRREGEKLQKMSYGLSAGGGAELISSPRTSVTIDVRYHYVLCRDRFIFGSSFTEQGILTLTCGASFYLTSF